MTRTSIKKVDNKFLILLVLAFFTVAVGLWGNYRQLWLAANNLSAASISKVISIASVVASLSLAFYTQKFSINKLKSGMIITLIIKIIISIILLAIDGTNNLFWLKFLSFFDIACENIIITSIYPYIMSYQKSDELYGKKTVVENLGKTAGVFIGSLLFGHIIFNRLVGFKSCLIISIIFVVLALVTLLLIKDNKKKIDDKIDVPILKYLKKEKLLMFYLLYNTISNLSYNVVVGLKMLMLTTYNNFSTQTATYIVLMFCVIDIIFGALAIRILKSQNDYVNISIKFLVRIILYIIVFLTNNPLVLIIAMGYTLITNISYSNLISGFMTNNIKENYVLDFTVINYIFQLIGEAIGIYIAGVMFNYGFAKLLLVASGFMIVQLIMAYYIIYRKRQKLKQP